MRVADRCGIGDDRPHGAVFDAERLGRHHRHRRARAADIGAPGGDERGAVVIHLQRRARFAAAVEPVAAGHPASLVLAERCLVGRMVLQRLQGFDEAGVVELAARHVRRADLRRVLDAQVDRVDVELLGDDIHHPLNPERRDRRPRRAIGRRLRPIAHHVVADRQHVRNIIGGEPAQAAIDHRRARESPRLVAELTLGRHDRAVLHHAHLDPHRRARSRPRRLEHLVARHREPHRQPRLLRQHQRHRLEVGDCLAAKPTADFRRHHPQVALPHAGDLRRDRADGEMPLARTPDLPLPVRLIARHAAVRLDIRLMNGGRLELLLHHEVRLGETRGHIAHLVFDPLGDVRRLRRRRLDAPRDHILEQQRRIRLHRLVDVDDVRQHLVIHHDQRQRLLGDRRTDRRHRRHRMALIQRLLARHDVARHMPHVLRHTIRPDISELLLRQIRRRHHRLHARQRQRLGHIDAADPRMRMRAAQHPPIQHPRQDQVGAILRPASHLRHTIRPDRPRADDFVLLGQIGNGHGIVHGNLIGVSGMLIGDP